MSRKCKGNLKKEDSDAIRDNYITLQKELEPGDLSDYLYQQGIFDEDDLDEIKHCRTRKEKATKLIEKIQTAGPYDAYEIFLTGLEKKQNHLVRFLKKSALIRARNERCPSPQDIPRDTAVKISDPLIDELDRLYAENDTLKEKTVELTKKIEDLMQEKERLNIEIEDLKNQNVIFCSTIEGNRNDNDKLNSEIQELKCNFEDISKVKEKLSQKLQLEKRKYCQLQQGNFNLNWQNNNLSSRIGLNNSRNICEECQSDSILRSILQLTKDIDDVLVKILETILPDPTDTKWKELLQELLVFIAFWNFEKSTHYLLKMNLNLNSLTKLKSNLFVIEKFSKDKKHTECMWVMSPLMAAAANESYNTLLILLNAKADVNAVDELGDTALIYLCREDKTDLHCYVDKHLIRSNKESILDMLISKGAKIDVKGNEGMTALMHCARNGSSKCIQSLSSNGVNMKAQCDAGRTALMYASFYCADFKNFGLQPLLNGSDINATDKNGDTALLYSITSKNCAVFNAIIGKSPNVNIQNKEGVNAIMLAAMLENDYFLSILLKHNQILNKQDQGGQEPNLKLNERDQDGNTALIRAILNNRDLNNVCAKLLIKEKGIEPNVQNNKGETALIKATQLCKVELVKTLIAEPISANVNIRDTNQMNALNHARKIAPYNSKLEIIDILLQAGTEE